MNDWLVIIDLSFNIAAIVLSVISVAAVFMVKEYDRRSKWFLTLMFLLVAISCGCLIAQTVINTDSAAVDFGYLSYIPTIFLMPLCVAYILYRTGEKIIKNRLFIAVSTLTAISILSTVYMGINGYFDRAAADGATVGDIVTPLAVISLAVTLAIYVLVPITAILKRKKLPKKRFVIFLLFAFPLTPLFTNIFLFEILVLLDLIDRYIEQKNDNIRKQAQITVLQMRPHFIYNTMTSIYYLCEQDPKKAQQVTLDFTNYLKRNFTVIANEGTVPFEEELEHAKAYLAVEQARFEDKLTVEFNISTTAFRLPALTLQPIVENAVKHGLSPELKPLNISVSAAKTGRTFEITVKDNGVGFSPEDNGNPHIALDNIKKRLDNIGGKLSITTSDAGTTVCISIPQ